MIDQWGVGHEPSPNSMHMTYMRHPLENAETLEELEAYPYPDFAGGSRDHQKEQVRRVKEQNLIALGDMQMTIWEIAWYLRGMEELFCDMMEENEMAVFMFDKALEMAKVKCGKTWISQEKKAGFWLRRRICWNRRCLWKMCLHT